MSTSVLLLSLALFWTIVHLISRYTKWGKAQLLPAPSLLTPSPRRVSRSTNYELTLNQCYLRIEFLGLNRSHGDFMDYLSQRQHDLRRGLSVLYDLGSIAGMIGMLISVALLAITAAKLAIFCLVPHETHTGSGLRSIEKRSMEGTIHTSTNTLFFSSNDLPVKFIIPGVTVPLSHIFPILLSLFLSEIIHEAGHAISAAMESIPLLSIGSSLTLFFPAAFVSMPVTALETLSSRAKLRIMSSGPFHNLLLWICIWFFSWIGFSGIIWSMFGYRDIRHYGRVVISIDQDSPLNEHLSIGSVIVKLDDLLLSSSSHSIDLWSSYLTAKPDADNKRQFGWCVGRNHFSAQSEDCCTSNVDRDTNNLSCFTALVPPSIPLVSPLQRCLSPLSLLDRSSATISKRCEYPVDCDDTHLCVKPRTDEELLRITFWTPNGDDTEEKTLVWDGPREEVFEAVDVSTWLPRFGFLPLYLPQMMDILTQYISALTLSLYLLNLLPLPFLDGGQFFDAALDILLPLFSSRRSVRTDDPLELDDMEAGYTRESIEESFDINDTSLKERIVSATYMLMVILGSMCATFTIISSVL